MARGIDYDEDIDLMNDHMYTDASYSKSRKRNKQNGARKNNTAGIVLGVVVTIIVLLLVIGLIRSPRRGQCRQVIEKFQTACNNMDMGEMIACIKPSLLTAGLTLGTSAFSQESVADFFTRFGGSSITDFVSQTGMTVEQVFKTISIEPKRFGFPKKTRRVRCRTSVGSITGFIDFYITKVYGDPYIEYMKIAME